MIFHKLPLFWKMVSSLVLWKMLHTTVKRQRRRARSSTLHHDTASSHRTSTSTPVIVKVEKVDHIGDFNTCRVCLKKNGVVPIHGNIEFSNIPEDLNTIGGIEVTLYDSYPKHLCKSCHTLLQNAVLFRNTAQHSDRVLKQSVPENSTLNEESLSVDDDNDNVNVSLDYEDDSQSNKTEAKQKSFHCNRCNLDYETYEELEDHRLSDEHDNKKFPCPICKQMYVPAYIKRHIKFCKSEWNIMCDVCGKKFVQQGHFNRHRSIHSNDLPYKCSLCPYRGRFSESLKLHMRTHTGYKPYQCPLCPSRFFSVKSNLNKHMYIHKEDHDFKCDVCQKGFYTKAKLDMHYKVQHMGIKDHPCNICGKVFGNRKQMMKHQLKVHKREKLRCGITPLYLRAEKAQEKEDNTF